MSDDDGAQSLEVNGETGGMSSGPPAATRPPSTRMLTSQRTKAIDQIRRLAKIDVTDRSGSDLSALLEELEQWWQRFEDAHSGILDVSGPSEKPYQEIERDTLWPVYESTRLHLEAQLDDNGEKERAEETAEKQRTESKRDRFRRSRELAKSRMQKAHDWASACDARSTTVSALGDRMQHLEQIWAAYYIAHDEVMAFTDAASSEDQTDMDETEELFFVTKSRLRRLAAATSKAVAPSTAHEVRPSVVQSSSMRPTQAEERHVPNRLDRSPIARAFGDRQPVADVRQPQYRPEFRLPQVELPRFSGGYSAWTSFKDRFMCLIGSDPGLAGITKLHYLKSCVDGEAEKHIRAFPITDRNFPLAWSALADRYDNARLIVNTHLQALLDTEVVREGCSSSLRKLMDVFTENVSILASMNEPVDEWHSILTFLISSKLDADSVRQWELSVGSNDRPTFGQIQKFVESRCRALDAVERNNRKTVGTADAKASTSRRQNPFAEQPRAFVVSTDVRCEVCSATHRLYTCQRFCSITVEERRAIVMEKRLCFNCLSNAHQAVACTSSSCRVCGRRHHTSLHVENEVADAEAARAMVGVSQAQGEVLLATAQVLLTAANGEQQLVWALIDPGAQCNFITESCRQRLNLKKAAGAIPVHGIGQISVGRSSGIAQIRVSSAAGPSDFAINVSALVMSNIAGMLPGESIGDEVLAKFAHVKLADPQFNVSGKVELLLGADVFGELCIGGTMPKDAAGPFAQNTMLGWIVLGSCASSEAAPKKLHALLSVDAHVRLEEQVKSFWEVEELPDEKPRTAEEELCEQHYSENTTRNKEGRYVVRMPTKPKIELGHSRSNAMKSMSSLEKRLRENSQLREKYVEFMKEYEQLGHMERATAPPTGSVYYLPHLAVVTTKIRVVFDASRCTSTEISLNDNLLVGPKLQDDIMDIVLRFRCRRVAMTSDVAKMYRQIIIHPDQRDLQRVLWRNAEDEEMHEFRLTTVTYGTSSAPYLAVRTLKQLAEDEGHNYPIAAGVLRSDFYVDDLMTGCDSVEEAAAMQQELVSLLAAGGFELRKWATSHPGALVGVALEDREQLTPLEVGSVPFVKALGLFWCPHPDEFRFRVEIDGDRNGKNFTKRLVLSEASKLFDPLGLMTPVVVIAKIFVQSLWKEEIGWDEGLRESLSATWAAYRQELPAVQAICQARWVGTMVRSIAESELHGFCDASEKAYCAVIYVRTRVTGSEAMVRMLVAKSKVAPKKPLTVPRLELCGALLLARLLGRVLKACEFSGCKKLLWTDSQLVLWYLTKQPADLKTFVRHRVSKIIDLTQGAEWRHVPTKDNPADIGSRGVMPSKLASATLWWSGPAWLVGNGETWPPPWIAASMQNSEAGEIRNSVAAFSASPEETSWCERFSSLRTLVRVAATLLRFASLCKKQVARTERTEQASAAELSSALTACIRMAQMQQYSDVFRCCENNQNIPAKSPLSALLPYIDEENVLRVGGRLQNAAIPFDQTHQMVIPPKHHISMLIIRDAHVKVLHGSVQLTMATLRQKYWMVGMRREVTNAIRRCVICFRWRQRNREQQIMGSLPKNRVMPNRAFLVSGVDYAGPVQIKSSGLRSARAQKAYIAVFVCFSTRAVHLELVSDLTSEAFLAALHRFTSRRGRCTEMHSDCGTNFVGADKELRVWMEQVKLQIESANPGRVLADEGTQWKFIPAGSPSFGGLWESAVKSTKHHLRRVLGDVTLTFEGLTTVLTQVEACLNSRPLCAMSDNPDDLVALTPGHFLIGCQTGSTFNSSFNTFGIDGIRSTWPRCKLAQSGKHLIAISRPAIWC